MNSASLPLSSSDAEPSTEPAPLRWTAERAWAYERERPWQVGFNYMPASCVNFIEMWGRDTFRPDDIEREMSWAQAMGFTSARVYLQFANWRDESDVLFASFERFLDIAWARGISSLVVLFDGCGDSGGVPACGPQGEPIPGHHNSRQMPSPGHPLTRDPNAWPQLERYVRECVGRYAHDERVYAWDIYNEPGQCGLKGDTLPLLQQSFAWARQSEPSQPLTSGIFTATQGVDGTVSDDEAWIPPLNDFLLANSDLISFHCYGGPDALQAQIASLRKLGRPLLCTEWLARHIGSHVESCLPIFARERVGCYTWGLVNGRSQTHIPWFAPPPEQQDLWFHDILRADGSPYTASEADAWRAHLQPSAASGQSQDTKQQDA